MIDNWLMASYVLIDTNLLAETTRLLRTGLGPSLLYFAKIRERKILMPEVVRIETRRHVIKAVLDQNAKVVASLRSIREFMGDAIDPTLSGEQAIGESVDRRFHDLRRWIHALPNSTEFITKSADRVFTKRVPSHWDGHDAFKDCLIWEAVLSLSPGSSVDLASNDARAFFDPAAKNTLHPALSEEAATHQITVRAHRSLESLVQLLQGDEPELDRPRAEVALNGALTEHFIEAMSKWKIEATGNDAFSLDAYLTEEPGILYLEFAVDAQVEGTAEVDGVRYEQPKIRIQANCRYDPHGPVQDLRVTRIALISADGRELQASAIGYAQGSITLGLSRQAFHTRHPLRP
jgi:hypothetical protein